MKKNIFRNMSKKTQSNLMLFGIFAFTILFLYVSFFQNKEQDKTPARGKITQESVSFSPEDFCEDVTLHKAKLLRVVDGDTFEVSFNDMELKVRLLGVDTPECVHPDDTKNSDYGDMASRFTKKILKNKKTIYLEFGSSTTDKYGRLLAYVWLDKDIQTATMDSMSNYMLNYILVDQGYAYDKPVAPNLKYAEMFEDACENAKLTQCGLWSYKDFRTIYESK